MYKCETCGAIDSRISNGDNQCCSKCGDTEGLVYIEEKKYENPDITPGPWRVGNYRPYRRIVAARDKSTDNDAYPGKRLICDVKDNGHRKANAQAISAVPDMIITLINAKGLFDMLLDDYSFNEDLQKLVNQIDYSLKKAGVEFNDQPHETISFTSHR